MILFESVQTYRVWEFSFVDQSFLLRCQTGPEDERIDLLFWHLLYYEIPTDDLIGLTVERLDKEELEYLNRKIESSNPMPDEFYFALCSGGQRWYAGAFHLRFEHHIASMSELDQLLGQMPPSGPQQTIDALAAANNIPEDCFWWASDYEEDRDVLILHALQGRSSRKHYAQLFIYGPQYMSRPGLLEQVEFLPFASEHLPIPNNILTDSSQIITLRPKVRLTREDPLVPDPTLDAVVVCQAVRFVTPMGFLHDLFHREQNIYWHWVGARKTVVEMASSLKQLDGADLRWKSISSQLSSEGVFTVTGSDVTEFLVFAMPHYVDIPKDMHNVRIHPPTQEDWARIRQRLGPRLPSIEKMGHAPWHDNVVVIECNEGWFFMYTHGAGFYSR